MKTKTASMLRLLVALTLILGVSMNVREVFNSDSEGIKGAVLTEYAIAGTNAPGCHDYPNDENEGWCLPFPGGGTVCKIYFECCSCDIPIG